jgi:hypothetical protein
MAIFWVVALCSLVEVYRRFRGAFCLHHQGDKLLFPDVIIILEKPLYGIPLSRFCFVIVFILAENTNSCDRVIATLILYFGGPRFEIRPGDRLSWLRLIFAFLSPSQHWIKIGYDCFLSTSFPNRHFKYSSYNSMIRD